MAEPNSRRGGGPGNRRRFLGTAAKVGLSSVIAGGGYGVLEAKWYRVVRVTLGVPNLPRAFVGSTIAFLSDIHHGPFVPLGYIRDVVSTVNALEPEVVALGGDYVHKHRKYITPGIAELGRLEAKLGRFAVLGNHDHWEGPEETRAALADAGIDVVTNAGVWLERGGQRLRICGVGDLWEDTQDIAAAVGSATDRDAVILLSHNPDFVEDLRDRRVGLVLSGHTHGGQAVLPGYGAPWAPTRYGTKYLRGLVQGPVSRVFVTRGVGTVGPPARFFCRPEIVSITLVAAPSSSA